MLRIYSRIEVLVSALLSIALGLGVFVYIGAQSMDAARKAFDTQAQISMSRLRSSFNVVDGVATSLRALPFSKLDPSRVTSYARTIIADYSFITGLGRYESVPDSWLNGYVEGMRKLPEKKDYTLWVMNKNNERVTLASDPDEQLSVDSEHWFPVSHTVGEGTQNNLAVPLSGLNIGSIPSFDSALQKATHGGNTTVARIPELWSKPGLVIALRSSYKTYLVPKSVNERTEISDGGYWLMLDLNRLSLTDLGSHGLVLTMFDTPTEYSTNASSEILFSRKTAESGLLFSGWFSAKEWLGSFSLGNKTLLLKASEPRGLTQQSLLMSLSGALLVLVLSGIVIVLNGKRRQETKLKIQQSEQLYREQQRASVTLASIGDAVISTDVKSHIQYANNAAENMLGISASGIKGKSIHILPLLGDDLMQGSLGEESWQSDSTEDTPINVDRCLTDSDGEEMYISQTISPLHDIDGKRSGNVIVLRDVSAEKALTRTLEHRVNHDPLTGLANRVKFESCLQRLFEEKNQHNNHAVCFIDLDRFKQINDTCGHAAGDRLLVELSDSMQTKVRAEDTLARLGGDEFGIVLHDCEPEAAVSVVRRIQDMFSGFNFEHSDKLYPVRGSIGVVNFVPANTTSKKVLENADAACYAAKSNGCNNIYVESADDNTSDAANIEELWVPRLQSALEFDGFELYLQPIFSLGSQGELLTTTHHEFLLRLADDKGVLTHPGNFLKPAERSGMMGEIDRWVIENCLRIISVPTNLMSGDVFSINLSGQSVKSEEVFSFITERFEQYGVPPEQVCFEIKEGDVLNNFEESKVLIQRLREYGCLVALDDFGADLSSFSGLSQLELEYIKLDEVILAGIAASDSDRRLLSAIASFAQSMGIQTIAEKVESLGAIKILAQNGIDYAQGHAVGKPLPASVGVAKALAA